ncbi:TlpA disulfide reductase family protein [Chitinophaga sp. XS-30]|uniref:TlpA family protein disulfide reductase n=1 Tax=Chitinophaga sp. XS-30 TaxID=2604421 RepID=UPI0011DCE5E0|nr:TlpA disulfide reductase family protein [Chitinophaga sp. XS-30]QEH42657.1 AhpC/TSA family protein [Chitinophaga sp. XS-30]
MKKYLLCILVLCGAYAGFAQSILTGKINGAVDGEAELNISRDVWYQRENSIYSKIGPEGTFSFSLPQNAPVFVTLHYNKKKQQLLLSPGRPLHVTFDAGDLPGTMKYKGKGATENMMIHAFFPPRPFFMKEFSSGNPYGKMGEDSLLNVLLPSILREADSLRGIVADARLPKIIGKSLMTHIRYYYSLNMDEFSMVLNSYTKNPAEQAWADTLMSMTGLPSMQDMESSPYAGYFLSAYAKHEMIKIGKIYRKDKERGQLLLEEAAGLPFDSLMKLANSFGDEMVTMLVGKKKLPAAQYERLLSNRLTYYGNMKELSMARQLLQLLTTHFADGTEAADGSRLIARLEAQLEEGKRNPHIIIRKDYAQISSLRQLLAPYKGKVVYLDVWGTWCGPCKVEMGYVPDLKARLDGNDIVFLYLSNDKDDADGKWREYVQVNNITGEHVRMPNDRIEHIWEELLPGEKMRSYPTFFIFGKDGGVAVKKARRPSEGLLLDTQLLEYL